MKKVFTLSITCIFLMHINAQLNVDTLAIQDFELVPTTPTWNFTGPVIYNSNGFSSATAAPPNSPIGIGGSRAWETTTNSGGLLLEFANTSIPAGYDSIRVHFNLAAMNLNGSSGGPDNLDYVLVAYSTDGGSIFSNRLRIRGAVNDNCFWAYDATGVAKVNYLPATEALFQPINTGLATTLGFSNCEIVFPGTVTQVMLRITCRSSSSTDTWLVDNVLITGENGCSASTSSVNASACNSYTAPSGAVLSSTGLHYDTIPNFTGCDSVISINLTINNASTSTINPVECDAYLAPGGAVLSSSGTYLDTIPNSSGCDSVITINLTINSSSTSTINPVECGSYLSPAGNLYTNSGTYNNVIPNSLGCDSMITINLTINNVNANVNQTGNVLTAVSATGTYQWINCTTLLPVAGETNQSFAPVSNGNYALVITDNGCTDTSSCFTISGLSVDENELSEVLIYPNPVMDYFTIDMGMDQEKIWVEIMDGTGRVVKAKCFTQTNSIQMNIGDVSPGVYLIRLTNANGLKVVKRMVKN